MRFPARTPRLITALFALALVCTGRAQSAAQSSADPTDTAVAPVVDPAKAPTTPDASLLPAKPKHDRVMSNEVAATLADGMPKYSPPPKPVEPKPEEEQADLRETDKPKNKIIRLQKFVVKEPKPPVFRDRDLESSRSLTDRGLKSNPGLHIGNLAGLNRPTALLMYEEQERLSTMADLNKDAKDAKNSGDTTAADYISKENNRANYRPSDFNWNSDNPAGK
jgi:hypothetical protein